MTLQAHSCGCTSKQPCPTGARIFALGRRHRGVLFIHLRATNLRAFGVGEALAATRRSIIENLRRAGARA